MSDRLAEIEATRKKILSEYEFSRADDDMLMLLTSGIPWLLAVAEAAARYAKTHEDIDVKAVDFWDAERELVEAIAPLLAED